MSQTTATMPDQAVSIDAAPTVGRPKPGLRSIVVGGFACASVGLILVQGLSRCGFLLPQLSLLSHFQLQYLLASLLCIAFLLVLGNKRWAIAAAVAALLSGAQIVPFYFGGSGATESDSPLRILTANVYTRNPHHQLFIDLINREDPDIIAVLEVDDAWMASLAVLQEQYPHSLAQMRDDNFGIALMSRLPLENVDIIDFINANKPTIVADVVHDDQRFHLVVTHPMRPGSSAMTRMRDDQMLAITGYVQQHSGGPIIVTGDLNTTMWSGAYRRFISKTKLVNARQGFGIEATWPSELPPLMRIPIDHLMHSSDISILDHRLGPNISSDHLPLIVDLCTIE